jgi:hypothetical protein
MADHAVSSPFLLYDQLCAEMLCSLKRLSYAHGSQRGLHHQDGLRRMDCFYSKVIYFCLMTPRYGPLCLSRHTQCDMKGMKKHCIGSAPYFTAHLHAIAFLSSCRVARYANVTKRSIFIQPVCCNHYLFLVKCGVILQWISLKLFLKLVESLSY